MGRYPEKALQSRAIEWLTHHRGFVECFSDPEGEGARMDSAGLLDGRLVLIEVKNSADAGLLRTGRDGAGPIECKVASTLRALYRGDETPLTRAAGAIWDRREPPLFVLLAARWSSTAREELARIIERRAAEWCFDWAFWRWADDRIAIEAEGTTPDAERTAGVRDWAAVDVPLLRATSGRAVARGVDELRAMATERGVGDLFDRFMAAAATAGHQLQPQRASLGVTTDHFPKRGKRTVFAAYIDASTEGRLAVGCVKEWLAVDPPDLPGTPSPKPFGFLNDDRFLSTSEEIDRLLASPLRRGDPAD